MDRFKKVLERLGAFASKWVNRAIAAQPDYERAVSETPTEYWQSRALENSKAYHEAMQEVLRERRWEAGISNPKKDWREMTTKKAKRREEGIRIVGPTAWEFGFKPFAEALARITLPPRGAKMSDANIQRAITVMRTMHETKKRLRGRGGSYEYALAPKVPSFY